MSSNPKAGQLRDRSSNKQLAEGELQLECDSGAVSVMTADAGKQIALCVVRGIPGRKAQAVRMNRAQASQLLDLLLKALAAGAPRHPSSGSSDGDMSGMAGEPQYGLKGRAAAEYNRW